MSPSGPLLINRYANYDGDGYGNNLSDKDEEAQTNYDGVGDSDRTLRLRGAAYPSSEEPSEQHDQ